MSTPKVSIIMLSYNHGRYIGTAIESVIAQTFGDWELVLVDDASPDDSWEVIGRYSDPRIHRTRFEQNRGAAAAYEAARARCTGEFLAHIDSDDAWAPEKLARQLAFLRERPEIAICCTRVEEIDQNGGRTGSDYADWFNEPCDLADPQHWVWRNRICHSSILMRRSLHDKVGALNGDLIHTPDWDLWIRCLAAGGKCAQMEDVLTIYRGHGGNITRKNPARGFREYAYISAASLHPWLYGSGRADLVARNIHLFMQQAEFQTLCATERQAIMHLLCQREPEMEAFASIYDGAALRVRKDRVETDGAVLGMLGDRYSASGQTLSEMLDKRNRQVEKLKGEKERLKAQLHETRKAAERRLLKNRIRRALGLEAY